MKWREKGVYAKAVLQHPKCGCNIYVWVHHQWFLGKKVFIEQQLLEMQRMQKSPTATSHTCSPHNQVPANQLQQLHANNGQPLTVASTTAAVHHIIKNQRSKTKGLCCPLEPQKVSSAHPPELYKVNMTFPTVKVTKALGNSQISRHTAPSAESILNN